MSGNLEASGEILGASSSLFNRPKLGRYEFDYRSESGESWGKISNTSNLMSFRLGNLHRYIEGEQVAAGWPAWLTTVAGEAIHGWVPLKAESFEKLEKVMRGIYGKQFFWEEFMVSNLVILIVC